MFCSTIIPTINRPTLTPAVCSVLTQEFDADGFEVIVVNDSGESIGEMDWMRSPHVRVIDTHRRERSVARNTGAALAQGRYLHFLDDDDLLLPGALKAFWDLAQRTDCQWLFGGYSTIDDSGNLIAEIRPNIGGNIFPLLVSGEAIPFQASLLDSKLVFQAGAFDPNLPPVEDRDLGRRIALRADVAGTTALVARLRVGEFGSSNRGNWHIQPERDRVGREKALNEPAALARLKENGLTNYWRGRVCRAYIASMVWNLQQGNYLVATSRGLSGAALGVPRMFQRDFRQGLRSHIERMEGSG